MSAATFSSYVELSGRISGKITSGNLPVFPWDKNSDPLHTHTLSFISDTEFINKIDKVNLIKFFQNGLNKKLRQ